MTLPFYGRILHERGMCMYIHIRAHPLIADRDGAEVNGLVMVGGTFRF